MKSISLLVLQVTTAAKVMQKLNANDLDTPSADPMGMVDGPSLYAYVRNNPIKLNDPDGMVAEGEDGLLIDSTGEITEEGKETLSQHYNKKVVKAVEQFSEEVTKYLENNEGVSLEDAIGVVLDLNEESRWMYVQFEVNNTSGWSFQVENAGLIYRSLNIKPGEFTEEKAAADVTPIDDKFVNNNELLSYRVPSIAGKVKEFRINNLDSIASINVSIRLRGEMVAIDSTVSAGDSLGIDLSKSFQGDVMFT